MENLNLCEICVCEKVCDKLRAIGPVSECDSFYLIPEKKRKRMTPEEAERVLMNIGDHVVFDDEYGCLIKSTLMDATLLAIRPLREEATVYAKVLPAPETITINTTEMCGECGCRVAQQDQFCPGCGATFKREKRNG